MGYSKENQRQNEALQSILDGGTPEKRIMVGYQGNKIELTEAEKEERKISSEKADVLKEARMPWFCPECNKIMKTRLDNKFYYLQSRCYDCVVKEETILKSIKDLTSGKFNILNIDLKDLFYSGSLGKYISINSSSFFHKSHSISPLTILPGGSGISRLIDSEVTDFPEPDSPTIPNTSPLKISNEISLTALAIPPSV